MRQRSLKKFGRRFVNELIEREHYGEWIAYFSSARQRLSVRGEWRMAITYMAKLAE